MRVLILGGTSEARALAARVAEMPQIEAVLSLAGRTREPQAQPIATRIGGFGGIDGLCAYLHAKGIERVVDATHPFAVQMSRHGATACARLGIPLMILAREPWQKQVDDNWIEVANLGEAVRALGDAPKRVFLTIGRLGLSAFARAPQHLYLVRTIDPTEDLAALLPRHQLILARGPFAAEDEERLMHAASIDVLVTKNSGGRAIYAKMIAARRLGLPVIVVTPPLRPDAPVGHDVESVLRFLSHEATRGV